MEFLERIVQETKNETWKEMVGRDKETLREKIQAGILPPPPTVTYYTISDDGALKKLEESGAAKTTKTQGFKK
ncbi:MAG: hypothetical protein V1721_10405 [Pseudomonadota bacterium]